MSEPAPPPRVEDPRHFELLKLAADLSNEGRYDVALIAFQAAAETYLELQVAAMIEMRELGSLGDMLGSRLVRNYTFTEPRLRWLWYGLTGHDEKRLKREDWWTDYAAHVENRHMVAHRGYKAIEADMEQSYSGVFGSMRYIQETYTRVALELGYLWEVGTPRPPRQRLPLHDRQSTGDSQS